MNHPTSKDFYDFLCRFYGNPNDTRYMKVTMDYNDTRDALSIAMYTWMLERNKGNKKKSARELNVNRNTVMKKIKRSGYVFKDPVENFHRGLLVSKEV